MDTLQAAILLEILEVFPDEVARRQEIGERYSSSLSELSGIETPFVGKHNTSVFAQYTILSKHRDRIQQTLKDKDIPSVSYYTVPLHLQVVFKNLGYNVGDYPVTEKLANECLGLPMSPYLSVEDQIRVIDAIFGR